MIFRVGVGCRCKWLIFVSICYVDVSRLRRISVMFSWVCFLLIGIWLICYSLRILNVLV